jgi:predicted dehydrogenase
MRIRQFERAQLNTLSVAACLQGGAEVAIQVTSVPSATSGSRLEIYGSEGTLILKAPSVLHSGPNELHGVRGKDSFRGDRHASQPSQGSSTSTRDGGLVEVPVPDHYNLVPGAKLSNRSRNVAQAYARLADALKKGESFEPDFNLAAKRHALLDAFERSSNEGRVIKLAG